MRQAAAVRADRLPKLRRAARLHAGRDGADDACRTRRRHVRFRRRARGDLAALRQRRGGRLQLAGAGGRGRPALRLLPAEPQPRRHERPRPPGEVAGARMRQATAALCHAALRHADRVAEGRGRARPRLRLPRGEPRRAGDDGACQRADHHQHLRGGLGGAGAAADRAGRALPHAPRPHAPRGRAFLPGGARHRRRPDRRVPGDLRRRAGELSRGDRALLRGRTEGGVGGRLCQRLRHHAPLGGLRRDLDPLSAHGRHARHRRGLRPLGQPGGRGGSARRSGDRLRPLPGRGRPAPGAGLAAADRGGEQPQPQHGPARPLPLRPEPERHREGALHPRYPASGGQPGGGLRASRPARGRRTR